MWLISSESMKFSDIFATGVLGLLVMSFDVTRPLQQSTA